MRILVMLVFLATVLVGATGAQQLVDRIVAVVEEDPVFLSDVDAALAEDLYLRRVKGEPMPADSAEIDALRKDLLDGIIERRIVIAKARQMGIEVTRTEVEDALDQWLADMMRAAGSESAFMSELEKQGITLKDFKANYRKDIEEQLLVSRFMRQQFGRVEVPESDVAHFFQTKYDSIPELPEVVGVSHIIIIPKIPADREASVLERVERIMDRLKGGEAFDEVASQMSEDDLTRESGGEIGLVTLDELQEEIAVVASELEPGQISDPIRTRHGLEILKLDGKEGDKYRLRHIFIRLRPEKEDTLQAARLAHDIRSRIKSGESFESLARQYSDDEKTKGNGGYVGEVEISALDDAYRESLANLNPGDVSEVVTTQYGFQILKLVSRRASRKPSFEEAKDWIRNVIETRKRESLFEQWLDEAREEIYVKRLEF